MLLVRSYLRVPVQLLVVYTPSTPEKNAIDDPPVKTICPHVSRTHSHEEIHFSVERKQSIGGSSRVSSLKPQVPRRANQK